MRFPHLLYEILYAIFKILIDLTLYYNIQMNTDFVWFQINLTQLPVLHKYTDLIYEIFRNNEIEKENEIERFKKLKEGKGLDF